MNHTEKAREIAEKLDEDAVTGHIEEGWDFRIDLGEPIIAAALADARKEALEEAAKMIEELPLGQGYTVSEAAARIRALKGET